MNDELRKRNLEISKGIIPNGYKKTKVGIVPVEWENTVFSKIFKEKISRTDDFEEYPLYSLTIEEGVVPKSERYERSHLVKKEDVFKIVEKDDFVYNPMNVRFGAVSRYKGEKPICVSGYYDIFSVNEGYSKEYMDSFLISEPMINYYNSVSTGSLKEKQRVHFSQFIGFNLPIPSLEEQTKIAEILSTQDKLISLQERKIEELKNLKKAYLSKMFPKNGSKYPELRFNGFTDAWEQRKLGDQMYIKARIGWQALTKSEYLQTGDYYLITGTDIDEDTHKVDLKRCFYVSKERYDMDDKIQVHEGDIIVTKDGTIGKVAMVTGLDKPATLNSHLFVLRDLSGNLDNYYLLTVLNSQIFNQFVEATKTGSTLTGLPQKTFVEFTFPVPSLEEQKQISGFFKSLDNTITLHQRKLDAEKQKKKALMQLLLTGKVRV